MLYTDGVRAMAELCKAYWLIDAIASHQNRCRRDPMLRDMHSGFCGGRIRVGNSSANEMRGMWPLSSQSSFSDFPLDEIQIWVQDNVDASACLKY